jgi:hypothetical protein
MKTLKTINFRTLKHWGPCYEPEQLAAFAKEPSRTPLEIATLNTGPWQKVSADDRLWVLLREAIIPARELRLLACDFAERALKREQKAGREPDARSWAAIKVSRRFADGKATAEELAAARAAGDAAGDAAGAAARAAAWAAEAAAGDAAGAAESRWQLNRTIEVLKSLQEIKS